MNHNLSWHSVGFAVTLLVLTACTSPSPTATPVPSPIPTRQPVATIINVPTNAPTNVPARQPLAPAASIPASTSTPSPYSPAPGDEKLQRANVLLDAKNIISTKSIPPQISLRVSGALPTPCHKLRIQIAAPNTQNEIRASVYSVVDSSAMCVQMITPFDASMPLENLSRGTYSMWVNDQPIGQVTMP